MKKNLFLWIFIFYVGLIKAQDQSNEPLRFIEVTGSAEMEVEPDEIRFVIGIEEYWVEEFEKSRNLKIIKPSFL